MSLDCTNLSNPPTVEELQTFTALPPEKLPQKFRRDINNRIFVNRTVNFERIKYVGFDMDYTLAVYKSPAFEQLAYGLTIQKLLVRGYPREIEELKYDPEFAVRGLFIDKKFGNILKIDQFGYILKCLHGKQNLMNTSKFLEEYPEKLIHPEDIGKRYWPIDTLFALPEACLFADIIELLENRAPNASCDNATAIAYDSSQNVRISYASLFEDIRESIDTCHRDGSLKSVVIKDFDTYIYKNEQLPVLLHRFRTQGLKVFLLTNSEYSYTKHVMSYLLDNYKPHEGMYKSWVDYFDICITNGKKPLFFDQGSTLREVDTETGTLKFTSLDPSQGFIKGKIYSGGNLKQFSDFTKTTGNEILYIGDNITHDIIFSKKNKSLWRTLLVVKELTNEISTWKNEISSYHYVLNLEYLRAKTYANLDSTTLQKPDAEALKRHIKSSTEDYDHKFNKYFGSLFRTGSSESYFSSQIRRFADLYCDDFLHLLYYPFFYYFSAVPKLLPHEKESLEVGDL